MSSGNSFSDQEKKVFLDWLISTLFNGVELQAVFNNGFAVHLTAPNIYRLSVQRFINDPTMEWQVTVLATK